MNIDIGLVKYTNSEKEEKYWEELIKYFLSPFDGITFNLLIYDNNINNIGLIPARNILLSDSISNYICFMDFDISIKNIEWKDMIDKLESDESVGIIAPITQRFSSVKPRIRWQDKKYLSCNFMLFKKEVFDTIGPFDNDFFVAYGDWDIIKRALDNGYRILQDNKSSIIHYGLSRENINKSKIWSKDFKTYILKHKVPLDRTLK